MSNVRHQQYGQQAGPPPGGLGPSGAVPSMNRGQAGSSGGGGPGGAARSAAGGSGAPSRSLKRSVTHAAASAGSGPAVIGGLAVEHHGAGSVGASGSGGGGRQAGGGAAGNRRKRRIADKHLPPQICELVPESQAYMDLLAFEHKLDATISRKRLDIQEALKRPLKVKRKLTIFVSNTFFPGKEPQNETEDASVSSWELRVEGRLHEELQPPPAAAPGSRADPAKLHTNQPKRKFSSFFKSLVIELDKDLYGPDNHLVEWHRTPQTNETDGFQVKRPGDHNVKCTILLLLDYQPMKFKLDPRLARVLGIHTDSRPKIIEALWQYIKTHKLQDSTEKDHINCDKYLEQIFQTNRMRFMEIPQRLHALLQPPDHIVIHHMITCDGSEPKRTNCYDIEVEIDDPVKNQMTHFMMSQQNIQDVNGLDTKIHETVEHIQTLKIQREFYLGFAQDPSDFIQNWLVSQSKDLQHMTAVAGQSEEERKAAFYEKDTMQEAINRYLFNKVQQKRAELDLAMGLRNN